MHVLYIYRCVTTFFNTSSIPLESSTPSMEMAWKNLLARYYWGKSGSKYISPFFCPYMSVTTYEEVSSDELAHFLEDIRHNIDRDEDSDFRKIILYLFRFSRAKLDLIQDGKLGAKESVVLVQKLLDTIELVLTKKRWLLSVDLGAEEVKFMLNGGEIGDGVRDSGANRLPSMLYMWAVVFFLGYLPCFVQQTAVCNMLKGGIISVVNLVTSGTQSFAIKYELRRKLLARLDDGISVLLHEYGCGNAMVNIEFFSGELVKVVNLFTILNDYDMSTRLQFQVNSVKLRFESYARKLWFLLGLVDLKDACLLDNGVQIKLYDNMKAMLVLNLTNNITLKDSVNLSEVVLLFGSIMEHLKSFDEAPEGFVNHKLVALNRSVAYSILRLFKFCSEKEFLASYVHYFRLDSFASTFVDKKPDIPAVILNALHLVNFHYGIVTKNDKLINFYVLNLSLLCLFDDHELDGLKFELHQFSDSYWSPNRKIKALLEFSCSPQNTEFYDEKSDKFNLNGWIQSMKSTIDQDSRTRQQRIFDDYSNLYTLISALGYFPCLLSGDLDLTVGECSRCGNAMLSRHIPDIVIPSRRVVTDNQDILLYYKNILCEYLLGDKLRVIESDPLLCCNILITIFKLFASFRPPIKYNINDEPVFKFVLRCLKSHTNRDVRILASRIIPLYLISPKDDILDGNFKTIFRSISQIRFDDESGKIYLAESTIKALGELAVISEGEWLCVLLIKLIDLFGETNEQHVNLAYNELISIAVSKKRTPYKLLSPFLPSIAERIIKHPRMLQKVTELLGVSKRYFLSRTKEYTTPRFLEYYKHDYLQEIANAANLTKLHLLAKNLPRIMATYLCKDDIIDESYILSVLGNASPEYKSLSMKDLISCTGEITWFILLQIQVDEKGIIENEAKINNALTYVSKVNLLKTGKRPPKTFKYIEHLLGDHVLELVQIFSENVHHMKGTKSYLEKVSSLKAIEFLISKNTKAAVSALGQISTCLQATLEDFVFEYPAIRCWNVLVKNLQTDHLISLFDIIISIIFQKFNVFQHRSKLIAVDILRKLFLELRDKYNKYSLYYFSIPFIENLDKYFKLDSSFRNLIKPKSRTSYFPEFTRRLKTGNHYVVKQALDDLINFTKKYQSRCQTEDFRDSLNEKYISELLRTLLDTAAKFKHASSNISTNCAKALAIIGSLDSNKFNLKTIKSQVIVMHDFYDYQENADFLRHFMEHRVIRLFWASNDPVKQLFSAYSMQKFLEVLGLNTNVLNATKGGILVETWDKFSDVAKSTLTPLLSSKYVSPALKFEPLSYPYYKVGTRYEKWLIDFTSDLLKRPCKSFKAGNDTRKTIFQTCSMLIRDHDISICQYLLKYVALSHIVNGESDITEDIKNEFLHILNIDSASIPPDCFEQLVACYQSIFEVLDYFNEWVSAVTQSLNDVLSLLSETAVLKKNLTHAHKFLNGIPMELIAINSAECDSYERTILYLEKCYRKGRADSSHMIGDLSVVHTLQNMYSSINDYDALAGILKKFSSKNLTEKLQSFQYNENWSLAQESFHVLSEESNIEAVKNNTKLLKSLSDHALYNEVLTTLSSKMDLDNVSNVPIDWSMAGLQAAVSTGDKSHIDRWLFVTDTIGTPQDVENLVNREFAKGIKFLFESRFTSFEKSIDSIYNTIGKSLVSSMSSSFSRNSVLMAQLHFAFDLALIVTSDLDFDEGGRLEVEKILKERLSNIDQSFESQWKALTTHRVANTIRLNQSKVSEIFLQCSKVARKNDRFDMSMRCIMKAMALNDSEAAIEYAALLWDQGKQTEAIKSLSEIILGDNFKTTHQKASVQLTYAEWLDESNHSSSGTIVSEYTKAYKLESNWEKPYYDLGKYYSKLMESHADLSGFYEQQIIRFFLRSLALGPTFIFEALPKFITVWLDFAQRPKKSKNAERTLSQVVLDINAYIDVIPVYVWYTSITQILSRIGHSHNSSAQHLFLILLKLVQAYPKHSLWFILSHLNSNDSIRKNRISNVLKKVPSVEPSLTEDLQTARELFESLIRLAGFKIQKRSVKEMSLKNDFSILNLNKSYNSLVIPVRSNLEIRLPSVKHTKTLSSAFPKSSSVTFDGFEDMVNVFHSLQMPRQLSVRGSNGLTYRLMVKKDDTRKDAKVVEFTTMINRLLNASTEARKRNLYISNYSVVPLAENMGVIEFVQDVTTMKKVINDQRARMGQAINDRKLFIKLDEAQKAAKSKASSVQDSLNALVNLFESVCEAAPPILHHWFIDQFSDPRTWYAARTSFIRSAAVMSIVGYIIGLGDRHCENILFFKKTGTTLHIDFDCLFEKGKTLPTPEIVPFRLTQNMVDAMGISGIEGTFRISCEVTETIIRDNEAPLMNILETLIYDPLLDWKNQQNPQDHLRKVRRKIRGFLDEKEGLPMNVHGQIDVLIQEASSVEKLCQMYGGWAPYI